MNMIESYVSAGSFKFGDTYDEVVAVLGEPCLTEKRRPAETIVGYDKFGATISSKGVVEVYFLPGIDVSLHGVDVFRDPGAFNSLCTLNGGAKEFMGFIILLKLGITLTGFHDNNTDQQAITAFEKGRWDQLLDDMREYRGI